MGVIASKIRLTETGFSLNGGKHKIDFSPDPNATIPVEETAYGKVIQLAKDALCYKQPDEDGWLHLNINRDWIMAVIHTNKVKKS